MDQTGMEHYKSNKHSSYQNGQAEAASKVLDVMTDTALFDSGAPKNLWGEAMFTSACTTCDRDRPTKD